MITYQTDNTLLKLLTLTLENLDCRYVSRDTTGYPNIEVNFYYRGTPSSVIFDGSLDDGIICKRVREEIQTQILLGEI